MTSQREKCIIRFLLFCCLGHFKAESFVVSSYVRNHNCGNNEKITQYSSHLITGPNIILPYRCLLAEMNNDEYHSSSDQRYSDDQFEDEDTSSSKDQREATKKKIPLKLNWDLPELFSIQEKPINTIKLRLLEEVYNAVNRAIETKIISKQNMQKSGDNSKFYDEPPIQSLEYDGNIASSLAPFRRFVRKYNYDMGHDGRFSVFGSSDESSGTCQDDEGASIQPSVVFLMDDPLSFILDKLTYRGKRFNSRRSTTKGKCGSNEVVIFAPGLHTFHERSATESNQCGRNFQKRTASERIKYYSEVLDGLPMAQIHAGTKLDQVRDGAIKVMLSWETMQALKSFGILRFNEKSKKDKGQNLKDEDGVGYYEANKILCSISATDVDILRSVISNARYMSSDIRSRGGVDDDNKQLKNTMMKLIDLAVQSVLTPASPTPNLVLMTYSTTSNVLAAALFEWKNIATKSVVTPVTAEYGERYSAAYTKKFSKEEAEQLLHKAVTVVTISALSKTFVDGPAYIHLSMLDDKLTSSFGVSKEKPGSGGKDAVFIQGISPYYRSPKKDDNIGIYAFEAHNMDSCAIQYLSVVLRINGVTSFRQLYNLAKKETVFDIKPSLFAINYQSRTLGQLEIPLDIDDELLPSMIRATGGERWLWNPKLQLGDEGVDGDDSPLPSLSNADAVITNHLGYSIYDEIVQACLVECPEIK